MKLQIGKRYRSRIGIIVLIEAVSFGENGTKWFNGLHNSYPCRYYENGRMLKSEETKNDLIEELSCQGEEAHSIYDN